MRILALNGSHRGEAGMTQFLLNKLAEGAREAGAEFETVALATQKINPCIGCDVCHTEEHEKRCIYEEEDDVKNIFERMRQADLLIYATPVYVFSMTGIMKTFFDRFNSTAGGELCLTDSGMFFHPIDKGIYSKPFVVLTCCGNVEQETVVNVISYFKTFSKYLDAPIVGTLVRRLVGVMGDNKTLSINEQSPKVNDVCNAYVQAGRELARDGKIKSKTEKRANQHLMDVPCLDLLMNFRAFKKIAIQKARETAAKG